MAPAYFFSFYLSYVTTFIIYLTETAKVTDGLPYKIDSDYNIYWKQIFFWTVWLQKSRLRV